MTQAPLPAPAPAGRSRISPGLLVATVSLLREHGHVPSWEPAAIRATIEALEALVVAFTGSGAPASESTPDPLLATAREHFAQTLSGGDAPSIRAVRSALHVGHPRARRIRDALTARDG